MCGDYVWQDAWNGYIADAVDVSGKDLLSAQISTMCPHYMTSTVAQKKAFVALFMAAIACPESGFNTHSIYWEGKMTYPRFSEGLMQLSYGDEGGYKHCKIVKEPGSVATPPNHPAKGNIQDPEINLQCGVEILNTQVTRGLGLFPKSYFYWSTLTDEGGKKVRDFWWKNASKLTFCF